MLERPQSVVPPRHLMPEPVQAAFGRRRSQLLWSTGFWVAWAAGLGAGLLPLSVLLLRQDLSTLGQVGVGLYILLPMGWAMWRRMQRTRRQADRVLTRRWSRFPQDRRWSASLVLAQHLDQTAGQDRDVRLVLQRLLETLFGLFAELHVLDRSIEADQTLHELGGDGDLHRDLRSLRDHRDGQLSRLVDALRELHLGFARRNAEPPTVRQEVVALLDQLDAEREVNGMRPAVDSLRMMGDRPLTPAG